MKIAEVRKNYPKVIVSYIPKKDYLEGIDDSKSPHKVRSKISYSAVYIAKDVENKYYLLYPYTNFFTGSFKTRKNAINWFRNGGR